MYLKEDLEEQASRMNIHIHSLHMRCMARFHRIWFCAYDMVRRLLYCGYGHYVARKLGYDAGQA